MTLLGILEQMKLMVQVMAKYTDKILMPTMSNVRELNLELANRIYTASDRILYRIPNWSKGVYGILYNPTSITRKWLKEKK